MLEKCLWQPLPGTPGIEIYPYLRKPDIYSSNSYLVRMRGCTIVIDPGALPEQSAHLGEVLRGSLKDDEALFIYTTHCHIDHSFNVSFLRDGFGLGTVFTAAQETGAFLMEKGDDLVTQSALFDRTFPSISPDILLLSDDDRRDLKTRIFNAGRGTSLSVFTYADKMEGGDILYHQTVSSGDDEPIVLYHSPGHCPDSICIRIGSALFMGDLLNAIHPFVAGIHGWNRKESIESLRKILRLLETGCITHCCPGHGRVITVDAAVTCLKSALHDAEGIGSLIIFDRERVRYMTQTACDTLEEAGKLISVIAGRLYYLSYQLDILEESDEAEKYRGLLDVDGIDSVLSSFQRFSEDFISGKVMEVSVPLKALQVIRSLLRVFDSREIESVISFLALRTERLLSDFIVLAWGMPEHDEMNLTDLFSFLSGIVDQMNSTLLTDAGILDTADDGRAFLDALSQRIASLPLFDNTKITLIPGEGSLHVLAHETRLGDTIVSLMEDLAAFEAKEIILSSLRTEEGGTVSLRSDAVAFGKVLTEKRSGICERKLARSGGRMEVLREEKDLCLCIHLKGA